MSRVESPSSINTYRQCPRKYYYRYLKEFPSKPSIYLVRGKIVHTVLEDFFDIDNKIASEDALRLHLFWLFDKTWAENYSELMELDMNDRKLKSYHDESKRMLQNWFSRFRKKLRGRLDNGMTFTNAFKHLTPIRELEFTSEKHKVHGFVDAIFETENKTVIIDYKTSRKGEMTPDYKLQLGIYAMMYYEEKGVKPNIVGIDFMNHTELLIPVDDKLITEATEEVDRIHSKTTSDKKEDYPQKPSPLCKWSNGQCDYYDNCFGR